MSKNELIGNNVSFYLDGGWQISGIVAGQESDKIILDKDGELFLLFKNKVSFFKINKEDKFVEEQDFEEIDEDIPVKTKKKNTITEEFFPENGISYSETFMNIPRSLLGVNETDDDLSVSFKETSANSLNFKVEDDS
ncbi:MAG: hypothetical protein F2817_05415 [Actinobacteria bacterium]|nr:hypothetical protein [Actinomycetota bacterium]